MAWGAIECSISSPTSSTYYYNVQTWLLGTLKGIDTKTQELPTAPLPYANEFVNIVTSPQQLIAIGSATF
ncbi:hypothetical protein [Acidianus brierleyi]|uniref:Uncharacterized protein n=1 Tax=Acidianus brierleyi TaxID=41673 RepID=A0A2U9IHI2_9CREN|nr:hypothetical protein [Acidianus brierleyi]AWR95503.1 hypothetical protein DFR85_13785 [Acidianus brierleyi]